MALKIVRTTDLEKDIKILTKRLQEIEGLNQLVRSDSFKLVRAKFTETIQSLYDEMMDLCEDPEKNAVNIKTRKITGDALCTILASIDGDIEELPALKEQRNVINEQLEEKNNASR